MRLCGRHLSAPAFFVTVLCAANLAAGPAFTQVRFACTELPFVLRNDASTVRRLPETVAGGIALLDIDTDGDLDLYFTNGAALDRAAGGRKHPNALFFNDGSGEFSEAATDADLTGSRFDIGVAAADYDGDGDTDLFLGGVHGFALFRNDDGVFIDVTDSSGLAPPSGELTVDALWLDADGDGDLDLFVVQYVVWAAATEPACTTRGVRDYCHPRHYKPTANRYYRNDGSGRFSDQTEAAGLAAHLGKGMAGVAADYDRDGDLDIYVTNDRVPNFLFVNDGSGRFTEVGLESGVALPMSGEAPSSMGATFADLTADGLPDLFFTALADETFPLFVNAGDGFFDDSTYASGLATITRSMAGWSAIAADFDNDGRRDLFVTRSDALAPDGSRASTARQTNSLFLGQPGGKFADASESSGLSGRPRRMYRGAVVGDLNGDGRLDLAVSALNANAEVCLNRGNKLGHWLGVQVEGAGANRNAIGAEVRIRAGGHEQLLTVSTSAGYASSSMAPLHFGIGQAETVELVEVSWPGRKRSVLREIATDQVLVVTEP